MKVLKYLDSQDVSILIFFYCIILWLGSNLFNRFDAW